VQNTHDTPRIITGIDVGGTKVHILDSASGSIRHYVTTDYPDLYAILDDYFGQLPHRPTRVAIAMAGPRDEHNGEVKMTNVDWPSFNPVEAGSRYPGTAFDTYNDMTATTAGVATSASTNFKLLKDGVAVPAGNKAVITISTGVGAGVAVWDRGLERYTFMETEFGHSGFQPYGEMQQSFLAFLFTKYSDPSWELALSGKYGVDNWLEFLAKKLHAPELGGALERADANNRPKGAVLLQYALEDSGANQKVAHQILDYMACLTANALADMALTYKATGGIYLTGSVSLALAEYWAERTDFKQAFVRRGTADHAVWLEQYLNQVPIYLVTDPHIAATGALNLASHT
jgi:glucokinase